MHKTASTSIFFTKDFGAREKCSRCLHEKPFLFAPVTLGANAFDMNIFQAKDFYARAKFTRNHLHQTPLHKRNLLCQLPFAKAAFLNAAPGIHPHQFLNKNPVQCFCKNKHHIDAVQNRGHHAKHTCYALKRMCGKMYSCNKKQKQKRVGDCAKTGDATCCLPSCNIDLKEQHPNVTLVDAVQLTSNLFWHSQESWRNSGPTPLTKCSLAALALKSKLSEQLTH